MQHVALSTRWQCRVVVMEAAIVSTEDTDNIISLHFHPVQHGAEPPSESMALLYPDWQTQQGLAARTDGGSNVKMQKIVLMSRGLEGGTFKLSLKISDMSCKSMLGLNCMDTCRSAKGQGWNNTSTLE